MSGACPAPAPAAGLIRGVLGAVDCNVRTFSEAGYQALTGPQSLYPAALTALLTIYVAVLGYRLMFGLGGARLGDAPVIGLKIGVVLAVSLGWTTFQTLVFDLSAEAPLEIARIVGAPAARSGARLAADPLAGLQSAYDELTADAEALARQAGPSPQALKGGPALAAEGLWKASGALFISTAGVFALASVSAGVLSAIGPIFIALFLFDATRGLFVGWVRAMTAAALAPMACWITTEIMLVVVEPWLTALARQRAVGALDPDTANAVVAVVTVFAIAQAGLLFSGAVVAGGFELRFGRRGEAGRSRTPVDAYAGQATTSRVQTLAERLRTSQATEAAAPRIVLQPERSSVSVRAEGGETARAPVARLGDGFRRSPPRLRGAR